MPYEQKPLYTKPLHLRRARTFCRALCGQFQPFTSAQTNPTPDLTLTLTLTLWGAGSRSARGRQGQSRRSAACFGGVFPGKPARRPKTQSRPVRPSCRSYLQVAPANRTSLHLLFRQLLAATAVGLKRLRCGLPTCCDNNHCGGCAFRS